MNETDDRLAGDPIWELFPTDPAPPARPWLVWAELILLVAGTWFLAPPVAIVLAGGMAAWPDWRSGWQMTRTIPDKRGGWICALFAYAWGTWKLGSTAFAMIFVVAIATALAGGMAQEPPLAALTAVLLLLGGFVVSATLTAIGLVLAYRSGLRIWIGAGINQARTLLLGMLLVGFTGLVLVPLCVLLAANAPLRATGADGLIPFLLGLFFIMFGAPVLLLILLDWFTRHIAADQPTRFGPKVPAVGKWQ